MKVGRKTLFKGIPLVWPDWNRGLGLAIVKAEGGREVASLFPFFSGGSRHTLRMKKVRVWDRGVDAQIEASVGMAAITFFDTGFLLNRPWYLRGWTYDFILQGIAYDASPVPE